MDNNRLETSGVDIRYGTIPTPEVPYLLLSMALLEIPLNHIVPHFAHLFTISKCVEDLNNIYKILLIHLLFKTKAIHKLLNTKTPPKRFYGTF